MSYMDFYKIVVEKTKDQRAKQDWLVSVDFTYKRTTDLIVKGGDFFAFWNGVKWSRDQDDLIDQIDGDIWNEINKLKDKYPDEKIIGRFMNMESSGTMTKFMNYCKKQKSSNVLFNTKILYSNRQPVKQDYSTYQLSYTPIKGPTPAFDELLGVLYEPDELNKILWAIGALLTGEIEKIEKFLYLYGPKGTGKGTVINIIKDMFGDYSSTIDLQYLTGTSEFATSVIDEVPLLIDSDTDLSKIKKEINLLKLTSHEELLKRVVYQTAYPVTFKGLLITASNDRYLVKNKDSGLVRRPIVVNPSGRKVPYKQYRSLNKQLPFEIPYIAYKAIEVFEELGPEYYEDEVDVSMIAYSDRVFDFVRENAYELNREDGITLKRASELYTAYLTDMGWDVRGAKALLKDQLGKYFETFSREKRDPDGTRKYSVYTGFLADVAFPENARKVISEKVSGLDITQTSAGAFDIEGIDWPAQYTTDDGFPLKKWDEVNTTLSQLDSRKLHYVRVPQNHIIIDFDIKNPETGEKDFTMNLAKANEYPPTYAEVSKSGGGIHLHYYYDGDVTKLDNHIQEDIEVKVYAGRSSLRRKFSKCNDLGIAHISSGLPIKEDKPTVFNDIEDIAWTEKKLTSFLDACLNKEHHGATRPEMDFIYKILTDAKEAGVTYDLMSYFQKVLVFAMGSSNQKDYCVKLVGKIPFTTVTVKSDIFTNAGKCEIIEDEKLFFYDIEVFPNLLVIVYKQYGKKPVTWINPTSDMIEEFLNNPLVGFNNRKYDNHIVYNRYLGADNIKMYTQSVGIIGKDPNAMMSAAYNLSYADIYEFLDIKKSLKAFEVDFLQNGIPILGEKHRVNLDYFKGKLGVDISSIRHDEFEEPWDQPLAKEKWQRCVEYCLSDVIWTEILFRSKYGQEAYAARKIMSSITDLPINTKTQTLAEKFLFGDDPRPQDKFVWYDLDSEFPGYTFEKFRSPQSLYHGRNPSEGGYVASKPGVYRNVMLRDIESLHPHSAIAIKYFGPYAPKFEALVKCRMLIKHKHFEEAAHVFDDIDPELAGKLLPFLNDLAMASGLGHAMKIIINIVYGMSSASYDNKFKAPGNSDNIIAKRGALFMMMLEDEMYEKFDADVIHIKTDSMKIADATEEMGAYMDARAREFGYTFDHEATFSKLVLVNKAALIGEIAYPEDHAGKWEPIGAEFLFPYTYKRLFTGEDVFEKDFSILKSAKSAIYLGEKFVGKNALVYASKTGTDMYRIGEADISKRIQTKVMAQQKKKSFVEIDMDAIAKSLEIDVADVHRAISTNYAPEMVDTYNFVSGTKGYKWRLWSDYQGYEDVDMGYYKRIMDTTLDKIYEVGDGNIIFEGTKYERPQLPTFTVENKLAEDSLA